MRSVSSRWFKPAARLFAAYFRDGGFFLAGAVSFFALMSFIPLLFLMINVFANIMGHSQAVQDAVLNYVKTIYPMVGPAIKREVARVVGHKEAGWISLFMFLWLGSIVFESLDYSLNVIFKSAHKRRFLKGKLLSFGLVFMSGVFSFVSSVLVYIPKLLKQDGMPFNSGLPRLLMNWAFIHVLPFLLTFISFMFLYKVLPKIKINYKQAATGALVASLLWEAAKHAFAWYMGNVADISIYGSFSAIILFLLWIYYSSTIFLLVAEGMYLRISEK